MTKYSIDFKTRGVELGASGVIPAATYLRYMEHIRWETHANQSSELQKLLIDGHMFVVVSQKIEIEQYAGLAQNLTGWLWIQRVGRTSFNLWQVIRKSDSGEIVAKAIVTTVYVDRQGKPSPLPPEIHEIVRGDDGECFEYTPELNVAPTANSWTRKIEVRPSDIDILGHVNQANYLMYFEDTRELAARAGAYGEYSEVAKNKLHQASLEYYQQTVVGDDIIVTTWPIQDSKAEFVFELREKNNNQPFCRARVTTNKI